MSVYLSIKDSLLLDDRLKAKELYLFLHMIRLCNSDSIVNLTLDDLMKETKLTNRMKLIEYLKSLEECGYIVKIDNIERKSAYQVNSECYFKR